MKTQKTILVAPLNWGLGHATRCMPIIDELLLQGAKIVLASDGAALQLLKEEYPQLLAIELPSYGIHYKGSNMFLNMAPQIPKILRAIKLERQNLDSIIKKYRIDAVIADNRYGLSHKKLPTVFITHQLYIQIPQKGLQSIINKLNHRFIQRFDQCWVPDWEGRVNLSGILSHPKINDKVTYLGGLSRFAAKKIANPTKKYDVIVVLSGPEPQRRILEQKIIEQAQQIDLEFLIVGGQMIQQEQKTRTAASHIEHRAFMKAAELATAIQESECVIVRSGYSTLMDLVALDSRKVLLIPTPGQTEQEYLAEYFGQQYGYQSANQANLQLQEAIGAMQYSAISFDKLPLFGGQLPTLIGNWLSRI